MSKDIKENKEKYKNEEKDNISYKKRFSKNRLLILVLIILIIISPIVLLTVAHFSKIKESENSVKKEKKVEEKVEKEDPVPETPKLKIVDENTTSRPFAIMINNVSQARHLQSGLQDAYIIYEMIVEGGITRYMALFLDQNTERIGSIRSSRHYYLDYALENDAIYVHHGQSPQAQSDFGTLGVTRIVADNSTTGWRDKTLNVSSEHTLFTSIAKLKKGIGSKRTVRNNDSLLKFNLNIILLLIVLLI